MEVDEREATPTLDRDVAASSMSVQRARGADSLDTAGVLEPQSGRFASALIHWVTLSGVLWGYESARLYTQSAEPPWVALWVSGGLMSALSACLLCAGAVFWWGARLSWPSLKSARAPVILYRSLWIGLSVGIVTLSALESLEWASPRFRQLHYRGLFTGLVAALVGCALLISLPALYRGLARLTYLVTRPLRARVTQGRSTERSPIQARLAMSLREFVIIGWVVGIFILCDRSAELASSMVSSLETVDLRTPRLFTLGLWGGLVFAPWVVRFKGALLRRADSGARAGWGARLGWTSAFGSMIALLYVGLSLGVTLSPELGERLKRDTALTGHLIRYAQRASDDDGDGIGDAWGGGDCDDQDAEVFPDAVEGRSPRDLNCNQLLAREARWRWEGKRAHTEETEGARWFIGPPEESLRVAQAPRNLILLTVDALRYDAYLKHMPKTRAFAKKSVEFSAAYSAGAATYWSIPALLGSRPPSHFKMGRDQTPVNAERLLTESLRDQGFHTGLFANVTIFFVRGLSQGALTKNYNTSRHTVHGAKPGARHLTTGLIKHIDAWRAKRLKPKRDRLFLWGHYYDPHEPYFKVAHYRPRSDAARDRYNVIVRSVDDELGRLFRALKARNMLRDTMVVITADHGEEFGEHGHRFHGRTLYEEMVRVPLIIYSPVYPAQEVDEVISHLDVAPTLLSHLGLKEELRFVGLDWDPMLRRGRARQDRAALFEILPDSNYGAHLIGMRRGDEKLIYHVQSGGLERFSLSGDPQERNALPPLTSKDPEYSKTSGHLMRYLEAHLNQLGRRLSGARFPR